MFPYCEYLSLAKEWIINRDEASLRCSVSRAYYACFHLTKEYASKNGIKIKDGGKGHEDAFNYLANNIEPKIQKVSADFGRLKNYRGMCDYNKKIKNLDPLSKQSIIIADRIFSNIRL